MKAILFNIHDLVLILTVVICAVLVGIFSAKRDSRRLSRYLLSCFFLLCAFIALDKLFFWSEAVKSQVFDFFPGFLLLFSFAFFAVGPVLYWYTSSRLFTSFSIKPTNLVHLIPTLLTPVYLYIACLQFPLEVQREFLLDLKIYDQPGIYFSYFVHLKKILPVVYGVFTLSLILYKQYLQKKHNTPITQQENVWLNILVGGFLLIWLWALLTHFYGIHHPGALSDLMGIVDNYLTLVLIVVLLFYGLAYLGNFSATGEEFIDPRHVEQIRHLIETEKPFLNPQLTLDRFARLVDLSPRQVSLVVNRSFNQNFHEYINSYRVDTAKRILGEIESRNLTIQEVAQKAGFNSKATFNRFFKNMVSLTPSEYRQNSLAQKSNK